jgi:hypothetical protein
MLGNIGERYIKLVKARDMQDAEYLQEMVDYEGGNLDSGQLDNYVLDGTDECITITRDEINAKLEYTDIVHTVFMYGNEYDRRMWGNEVQVYVLEDGSVYMDEALHDEAFC